MRNLDVHEMFKSSGVKKWMAAERLGTSDVAFSKKLRTELSTEEKRKIFKAIKELKKENTK